VFRMLSFFIEQNKDEIVEKMGRVSSVQFSACLLLVVRVKC